MNDVPILLRTIAIGAVGGGLFAWIGTPLPWMLGALATTMIASMSGLRCVMKQTFRRAWIIVLGVLLGSSFTPAVLGHMATWITSFVGMIIFVSAATAWAFWYYQRFGGIDRRTAFFCASPGGLGEMAMLGPLMGGDERTIVLVHATRIVAVMLIVPPAYSIIAGYVPPAFVGGRTIDHANLQDMAVLAASGITGALIAKLLRFPAWQMTGSMLASAIIHISGVSHVAPPGELIAAAQVVIGAGAGSRFSGVKPYELVRPMTLSFISTVVVLILALGAAFIVSSLFGFDFRAVHLSYSPGGLAEMSLIALSLGIEVPFVATHHIGRVLFVVLIATFAAKSVLGPVARTQTDPDAKLPEPKPET